MANASFGLVPSPLNSQATCHAAPTIRSEHALGLKAIYGACRALYPDQPTPLQVTALRKYWMGGPDPLDFINMYSNPGSQKLGSPPHWHYVTNGLSDLYGDSRLHSQCTSADDPSGFGFELTLRIRREPDETKPPTWPAHLLQSIARYIFHSQAQLMVGDHIPWPSPLDRQPHSVAKKTDTPDSPAEFDAQSIAMAAALTAATMLASNRSKETDTATLVNPATYASMVEAALAAIKSTATQPTSTRLSDNSITHHERSTDGSRIHHILVVEDPQLKRISTLYGCVQFLQLVGLCTDELRLVQRWTGTQVMKLMSRRPETGGGLLVTDMRRKLSLFELEPSLATLVNEQLRREGSNLSGVTTQYFAWAPIALSVLGELLPGEMEARRQRCRKQHRDSTMLDQLSSDLCPQSFSSSTSARVNLHNKRENCLPTDLTLPRNVGQETKSPASPVLVAMDTDETIVSSSIRKDMDEDDFVDVVGDTEPPSLLIPEMLSSESKTEESNTSMGAHGDASDYVDMKCSIKCFDFSNKAVSTRRSLPTWYTFCESDSATLAFGSGMSHQMCKTGTSHLPNENSDSGTATRLLASDQVGPIVDSSGFGTCSTETLEGPFSSSLQRPYDHKGVHTPGSAGDGSAPCTPLAHLSLSPSSLDLLPTQIIDCLDVHLCREAGEMLPLAVNDRLRHGRHFTFLNSHYPDHAITLVPTGVSGAFVSEESPYVSRGPWLQILIPDDFLEALEFQFSPLVCSEELTYPLVFRWPERRLRICLVDSHTALTGYTLSPQHVGAGFISPTADRTHAWASLNTRPNRHEFLTTQKKKNVRSIPVPGSLPIESAHALLRSPVFPYFPPGCVPPPTVLAAAFNSSTGIQPTQVNSTLASGVSLGPTISHSNMDIPGAANVNGQSFDGAMTSWLQFFSHMMHQRNALGMPGTSQLPWPASVPLVYQNASSALQHSSDPLQLPVTTDAHATRHSPSLPPNISSQHFR